MHATRPATAQPELSLQQLRTQLDELVHVCDVLADHLERERDRDLVTSPGCGARVSGLQQALLQVTRVRNDVRTACRDLEPVAG